MLAYPDVRRADVRSFWMGLGSLSEFIFSRRRLWIVALGMRRRAGKRHFCAGDCDVKDDCLSWSHLYSVTPRYAFDGKIHGYSCE